VLSDPQKRDMYNSTGCIDEEEFAEGQGDMAADIFAAFFGGGLGGDLDEEEQAMMDEFLRLAGGNAFNPFKSGRRRRGKKGRGGGGAGKKGRSSGRSQEEELMQAMMGMGMGMGGMDGMGMDFDPEPVCPADHGLKRRKAEEEYACDVCEKDILVGKRFYDCRKCDWCICLRCHKQAKEEAAAQFEADNDDDPAEIMQAFCEMNVTPVRKGNRVQHQCDVCKVSFNSADEVLPHMEEMHSKLIEEFMSEAASMPRSGLGGGDPMMDLLLGGMMGGMSGMPPEMAQMLGEGYPGASGRSTKQSGSRKKR